WPSLLLNILAFGLFLALAMSIVGDVGVALAVVAGGGLLLGLLRWGFALVALSIGALPAPERLTWWQMPLIGGGVLLSFALARALPAFGVLALVPALGAAIVPCMPRTWKAPLKLAMRHIGDARVRTSTTLVALFVSVFAIGLVLTLGFSIG